VIRVMSTQPTFYVQWSDGLGANMALISLKPRKESRQVESVEWRAGLGKPAELHEAVPLERAEIAPGLYKLTLKQPLEPGEYALAELAQKQLNIEVWDFGVEGAPLVTPSGPEGPPVIRRQEKAADN